MRASKSERAALRLEDKIPGQMHTLFVGINPAIRSAQVGHYYAHPTNMFWRLVSESGLVPTPIIAKDDDSLVGEGFGFTDVAKRPTANAGELAAEEFTNARARLDALVRQCRPHTIAFVSKKAARAFLERGGSAPIQYGPQGEEFHDAVVWFLPSTSGQSRGDTSFDEKLAEFRRLARHVRTYHGGGGGRGATQRTSRLGRILRFLRGLGSVSRESPTAASE